MSYKVTKEGSVARGRSEDREEKAFLTFEDLEVYQVAREFRQVMYGAARRLPDLEKYGLCSQIRRAAVSLTNNIAEGHGRFHYPDQIRFILHSRGSLEELVDGLNVCSDENYLGPDEIATLKEKARAVLLLINGYLRYLRKHSESVREPDESYRESAEELAALPL